jgi:hypothetical protein
VSWAEGRLSRAIAPGHPRRAGGGGRWPLRRSTVSWLRVTAR